MSGGTGSQRGVVSTKPQCENWGSEEEDRLGAASRGAGQEQGRNSRLEDLWHLTGRPAHSQCPRVQRASDMETSTLPVPMSIEGI